MKTCFCAAAAVGLLAAGLATPANSLTAQQKISAFESEDFAYSMGGPEPSALVNGIQIRGATVEEFPALDGQGVSMVLTNLGPCAIGLPHIQPRATDMMYVIEGNHLRVGFVQENGGDGAVINDLSKGDVAFFPQGLIHYQQNLDCEPASFLSAFNSEDAGAVTITSRFLELPEEAIKASLNFDDAFIEDLLESVPGAPATARLQCLENCALSYSYDSFE